MAATPVTFPHAGGAWSGSSPKAVTIPFTENGAAGTYTFTLPIKAGTIVYDVIYTTKTLWGAGTSATLDVGDLADTKGYMNDVDLKVTPALIDKSVNASAGTIGTYTGTRFYDLDDIITATVVTVGTTSTAGKGFLTVLYAENIPSLTGPTQA